MNLIINNPDGYDLSGFCDWLIPKIQSEILISVDIKKLAKFDVFIYNKLNLGVNLDSYDIIKWSLNLIKWTKHKDNYEIYLDKNITIPGTYITFYNIIKLIDNGNLSLAPYPIYTNTMEKFAIKLPEYFDSYLEGIE